MKLEYSRMEKIVGVFVIVSAALLLAAMVMVGRGKDWFRDYVPYYTVFNESYNLAENGEVKFARTTIGKIRRIALDGNKVRVDLAILAEYAPRITVDCVATVESPTIIGSEYVSIKPGTEGGRPRVPEGGRILSRPKKSLASVMEDFEVERMARLTLETIEDVAAIADAMSREDGPLFTVLARLDATLGNIEAVTAGIREGEGSVGLALRTRVLHDRLDESLASLERIMGTVEATSSRVPRSADTVQQSLEEVRSVVATLDAATRRMEAILANLEEASAEAPRIAREARGGITEMRRNLRQVESVMESVRRNPLIRMNLPEEPAGGGADSNVRP